MSLQYYRALMGVSFEPESIAYFARANASLSNADKISYDGLIKAIKTGQGLTLGVSNLTTIFDRMYLMAITSQATEDWRLDFFDDSYNLSGSGFAFTENVGVGASNESQFSNNIGYAHRDISAASQNDLVHGAYVTSTHSIIGKFTAILAAFQSGGNCSTLYAQNSGVSDPNAVHGARMNQSSATSAISSTSGALSEKKMISTARTSSTNIDIYEDGTILGSGSATSSGLPTVQTSIFSYPSGVGGVSTTAKFGFMYIGAESGIDVGQLQSDVRTWLIDRGVTGL